MDNLIQSQLDRVETALTALIDSIASYNPSIPATNALLAADDDLNTGLKQLAIHQSNHARLLQLRADIDRRNENITETLKSLAATRKDLLDTPRWVEGRETRGVPYKEVLGYAKRISRFTVPPTFRAPAPAQPPPEVVVNGNGNENGNDVAMKEGDDEVEGDKEDRGTGALEDAEKNWLDPLKRMQWVPWVSEQLMRSGALAEIQAMVERGEDLQIVLAGGVQEKIEEGGEGGEGMEGVRRDSKPGGVVGEKRVERREEKPKVFGGLDLYDPDEE